MPKFCSTMQIQNMIWSKKNYLNTSCLIWKDLHSNIWMGFLNFFLSSYKSVNFMWNHKKLWGFPRINRFRILFNSKFLDPGVFYFNNFFAYFCVWNNPIHNSFSFLFNGWKSGSLARVWIDHSVLYLQWARCFGCVNVCGCNVKWRDVLWFGVPLSPIRLLFVWPSSPLPKLPKYCACGQLHC